MSEKEIFSVEEDLKKFMARDNIIEDIIVYSERHKFESVAIYCDQNYEIKNVSAAFALKTFLNSININAEVIISRPERLNDFYEGTMRFAEGRFLAVCIGCKKLSNIDNADYNDSFVLFNVYGPTKTKGYGVLNYTDSEVSCSAEIIFQNIYTYCEKNNLTIPLETAQHLYTALVAGTKRYGSNIKKNTFIMAKILLDLGADYKQSNYLCEKKNPIVLKIQQSIFKGISINGRIGYATIHKADLPEEVQPKHFLETLSLFKKIDTIDVWILFVDKQFGYYDVFIQGKEINKFDVKNIAAKNNGTGDHTQAMCSIRTADIGKVLNETKLAIEKADTEPESEMDIENS